MKKMYHEKNKLPLTFKYIEIFKTKNVCKIHSNLLFFVKSKKYQSDYHVREKPLKALIRIL